MHFVRMPSISIILNCHSGMLWEQLDPSVIDSCRSFVKSIYSFITNRIDKVLGKIILGHTQHDQCRVSFIKTKHLVVSNDTLQWIYRPHETRTSSSPINRIARYKYERLAWLTRCHRPWTFESRPIPEANAITRITYPHIFAVRSSQVVTLYVHFRGFILR